MTLTLSRDTLIDAFARDVLGVKRISEDYLKTLARLLNEFRWCHVTCKNKKLSRRDDRLGPEGILRGLQKSLHAEGYLKKVIGNQGAGYHGPIFIYNPYVNHPEMDGPLLAAEHLYTTPYPEPHEILEVFYRLTEGEAPCLDQWRGTSAVPY